MPASGAKPEVIRPKDTSRARRRGRRAGGLGRAACRGELFFHTRV